MTRTTAQLMMDRETRTAYGPVPHSLSDDPLAEMSWQLKDEHFLLRGQGDHYFYYRKGAGIEIERGPGTEVSDESLWLNGSVYSAVASINGLVPIHASAVAHQGQVFAFTGPAGAGKSTLIAALGSNGLPMFCDDTLVLDLSDPERIVCLPGHKRLKLTPDAIKLTGAESEEKVARSVDKYYARPSAGNVGVPLPLAELIFLEAGPEPAITRISGSERFARIRGEHYTDLLFTAARAQSPQDQFTHLSRLAQQIQMARFVRPLDRSRFHQSVAIAAQHVTGEHP
jgi:hypothetical protein